MMVCVVWKAPICVSGKLQFSVLSFSNKAEFLNVYCNLQYIIGHKCSASICIIFGVLVMFNIWLLHIYELSLNVIIISYFSFHSWWNVGIACMNPGWSSKPFQRTSLNMCPVWQTDLHCFQLSSVVDGSPVVDMSQCRLRDMSTTDYILFCASTHVTTLYNSCKAEIGH